MDLTTGTILQKGKYTLELPLGQGGFGITYRAIHTYLHQPVVIKTLNESLRQHPRAAHFQQQFIAEAQRLARCQHPNIVRVLDFFEEGGRSFIVMDYIPGATLAELVQSSGPLPEPQAIRYIHQIGAALNAVHQNGLLHRDVKPQNLIRRQGTDSVVLIDFGIAREFTPGTTQTHTNLISAGYAPIEQYLPQDKRSPATDVYALAATLYYLVTGQVPIAAPLRDRVPLMELRQLNPQLSPVLERAIYQGMAMQAAERPPTIAAWLALLPNPALSSSLPETINGAGTFSSTAGQPLPVPQNGRHASPSPEATVTAVTLPIVSSAPVPGGVQPVNVPAAPKPVAIASNAPQVSKRAIAKPRRRLPPALLIMMIGGGLVGVGYGLSLRLGAPKGTTPGFFSIDQSFPPRDGWMEPETNTTDPEVPVAPAVAPPATPETSRSAPVEAEPRSVTAPAPTAPEPQPELETPPIEPEAAPEPQPSAAPSPAPEAVAPVAPPAAVPEPPASEPVPTAPAPSSVAPVEPAPPTIVDPPPSTEAPAPEIPAPSP